MKTPTFGHKQLVYIYNLAVEEWQMYSQCRDLPDPHFAMDHFSRCEAYVDMLENITVFHTGMGLDLRRNGLKDRLNSFNGFAK